MDMDRPKNLPKTVNSGGGPKQTAELGQMQLPNATVKVDERFKTSATDGG
jgi:hypothetical protein